ncbi:MAG: hypothetical protein R3C03_10070 [Pirellulaceae bacterium]
MGMLVAGGLLSQPAKVIEGIGTPTDDDVIYSQIVIGNIPRLLLEAARDVYLARVIVFCSLLDNDDLVRAKQLEMIRTAEGDPVIREIGKYWPMVQGMDNRFRMPIFEILQGTLVGLSPEQYQAFRLRITELIQADQKVSLFEFFLRQHLVVHLDRHFGRGLPHQIHFKQIVEVADSVAVTLSMLARVGHSDQATAQAAFQAGAATLDIAVEYQSSGMSFASLASAIERLSHSTFEIKKVVLRAATVIVSFDHQVTVEEAEMFRAFSESLDCPVPPLLASVGTNRN